MAHQICLPLGFASPPSIASATGFPWFSTYSSIAKCVEHLLLYIGHCCKPSLVSTHLIPLTTL